MSKKVSSSDFMYLKTSYDDGFSENRRLVISDCWSRFYALVDFFCHNPFCGLISISICDCREKPILTITNNFKTIKS